MPASRARVLLTGCLSKQAQALRAPEGAQPLRTGGPVQGTPLLRAHVIAKRGALRHERGRPKSAALVLWDRAQRLASLRQDAQERQCRRLYTRKGIRLQTLLLQTRATEWP